MNSPEKAIESAEDTWNEAIAYIEELDDDTYKESGKIIILLEDNLS
jgi:hypothetical protein